MQMIDKLLLARDVLHSFVDYSYKLFMIRYVSDRIIDLNHHWQEIGMNSIRIFGQRQTCSNQPLNARGVSHFVLLVGRSYRKAKQANNNNSDKKTRTNATMVDPVADDKSHAKYVRCCSLLDRDIAMRLRMSTFGGPTFVGIENRSRRIFVLFFRSKTFDIDDD
jgi:hypothetical protein